MYHSVKLHDDAKKHHIVVIMIHTITITNTTNNHSITYSTLKYSSTNPPTSSININSIVYLHSIHSLCLYTYQRTRWFFGRLLHHIRQIIPPSSQRNHYKVVNLYIFEDISVIPRDISAAGQQLHKLITIENDHVVQLHKLLFTCIYNSNHNSPTVPHICIIIFKSSII